jgi:hypothetical protein
MGKIVRSYNMDEQLDVWLHNKAKKHQRSKSFILNQLILEAMTPREKTLAKRRKLKKVK